MASNPIIDIYIPHLLTELQMQALHVWLATISSKLERRRPFARRNQRHHDYVREQRELLQLRLQLWQQETPDTALAEELQTLRHIIREKVHHYWHVGVTDGTQLDVAYPITNAVRPFSIDLQAFEPTNWEEDFTTTLELTHLIRALGTLPKYRIQVLGFMENPEDHLLCGYMASELAREYEAYAKVWLSPNFHTARGAAEWTQDDSHRLAQSLGGKTHEIKYHGGHNGETKRYHLLDTDAMREWTRHDRFFLHS